MYILHVYLDEIFYVCTVQHLQIHMIKITKEILFYFTNIWGNAVCQS